MLFGKEWQAKDLPPSAQQLKQKLKAANVIAQQIPAPEGQQSQPQPQTVTLFITPRPAERPRFSKFGGAYNSKNYSDYKKKLVELLEAKILEGVINPALDYAGVTSDFYLPIPKSWTKKEKAAAQGAFHRKVRDIDNMQKSLYDPMQEAGIFANDGQVCQAIARKWYVRDGEEPRIEIRLYTMDELINQLL